eukprot:NODE_270_length_12222_cov_0.321868.p3 type:complete len:277 gc:universal NODE_270_length_12222_cov_0.321868:7581-8411(+)
MIFQTLQLTRKKGMEANVVGNVEIEEHLTDSQELYVQTKSDSTTKKLRKYIFGVITEPSYNKLALAISKIMAVVIIGSVLEFALETVEALSQTSQQRVIFDSFSLGFNIIFSLDYLLKIIFFPDFSKLPKYLVKPFWLVDLISIFPFYFELIVSATGQTSSIAVLRIVRIVRIFRIFRLLKASRNFEEVKLLGLALKESQEAIVLLLFLLSNLIVFFASVIFYCEQGISEFNSVDGMWYYVEGMNTGNVSNFQSIPHTMWYLVVTMTTVGYGDMYL